jgi:amino acid transporter
MQPDPESELNWLHRLVHKLIGAPKDVEDKSIFHKISLIPILAWIGLGADGLSSSSYGPEEAFRALGSHTYLAVFLAFGTAFTVAVISYAYSRIIEHFPHGGGGYIVATHTISERAGVVSGCALLVDYMLTITVSLVSCGDALFSFLPLHLHVFKIPFVIFLIILLVVMNLRGVKESVTFLAPIFITFVLTHVLLLGYGILSHTPEVHTVANSMSGDLKKDLGAIGVVGILAIFLRAFSLGGGTYTGLEAVSNGMQIMREPKVHTGKRTMFYMATSLAVTAGGLFICYLLFNIRPTEGRTLNAILADNVFAAWPFGYWLALITILSEGALLIVGAQAGFIDGPRVMANMAVDSWFPRRFAALSERLTMQNGVLVMGVAAFVMLLYTHGSVSALVVMYSINVFLTFSLSQFGMVRFYIKNRNRERKWKQHMTVHVVGLFLCVTILIVTIYEKFEEGGWLTLFITAVVIAVCYLVRRHYNRVRAGSRQLDEILAGIPAFGPYNEEPLNPREMTAIQLVGGFNGFGLHTLLSIVRSFPNLYKNYIFVSVAEIDSGSFKGAEEVEALKEAVRKDLDRYVKVTRKHGFPADYRLDVATDVVEAAADLCESIAQEFPRSTVFTGKLVFKQEQIFNKLLHNETAFAIQRRLQWRGITTVILPIRVDI